MDNTQRLIAETLDAMIARLQKRLQRCMARGRETDATSVQSTRRSLEILCSCRANLDRERIAGVTPIISLALRSPSR
jgi:hypothetical protein